MAFLASLPIIPTVHAETIEQVYNSGATGTGTGTWRLGPYSMIWQTFTPSEDCFAYQMAATLGDANAAQHSAFFYGIIYDTYLSGSQYFPNTTGSVYGWTGYLDRYNYHSPAAWYNLTILDDAQLQALTHDVRYAFCLVKYNGTWTDTSGYRLYWYMGNTNNDANNNHGADSYADAFDHPFIVYADTDIATPPEYSNVGNDAVHNGYSVNCYSYWTLTKGLLDGYYFEHNATGTPTNSSYVYFGTQTGDWANATITLDADLGDVVAYKTYAQNTAAMWNETDYSYFTVSATVTFLFGEGGTLRREGTTITNGTSTEYSTPTNLTMLGVPLSPTFAFDYFAWYAGTETDDDNPLEWSVDWSTSFWAYFTNGSAPEPSPYEPPIIPSDSSVQIDLWFHADTQTVNNVTGFAALNGIPDEAASVDVDLAGNNTITWGWRVYLQYEGSATELTNGSPVATVTQAYTGGNQEELLNATYEFDETALYFGRVALKFYLYMRWNDTGAWSPMAIFISDYLYYPQLDNCEATFFLFANRTESDGYTIATAHWGTDEYLGGVVDLTFSTADASDYQGYYLGAGNFLAFLTIPYTAVIGNTFYALVIFGIAMSIYIRYRQLSMIVLFITILGGAGGAFNLLVGDLFMGIAWVAAAFGLGLVYWRVFR